MRHSVIMLAPVAAAALIMTTESAQARPFSGAYAPANWTFTNNGGSGAFTNDGATLTITGDNGGLAGGQNTDYTIAAAAAGTVTFDWSYTSADTGTYDSGGYLKNGVYTALATNAAPGSGTGVSVTVNAGDIVGFRVFSFDGIIGAGTLTITNFNGPVPAPGALALLGLAGMVSSRRRRRT